MVDGLWSSSLRCTGERRSQRFHDAFLRRQGHLSERLSRRVKRIQNDHCEIQSKKQQSILPCVVSENACAFLSVLHFLKPHRVHVERKRQDAHSIYMRIGSSTGHWAVVAGSDAIGPVKGSVSESVLPPCACSGFGGGQVLLLSRNLQREDFQKVFTVNFLAACCDAFSIPVRDYIDYLKSHDLPLLAPKAATSSALPYDA
eukprot:s48_g28.t1